MAQAKKKSATKTAKKPQAKKCATTSKKRFCYEKYDKTQKSNTIFVVCMSVLAATLLFANLLFMA